MKKNRTWVELPASRYGIEYVSTRGTIAAAASSQRILQLNPKRVIKRYFRSNNRIWKKSSKCSPFAVKLADLDHVTRRFGGDGIAVMYIREIFEPGDVEYDYIGDYVCAAQLSQEQVDRLRVLILPKRREETLVGYLDFYKTAYQQEHIFNESTDVLRHYEGFHRRYLGLAIEEGKEKFDLLFSFTFAIKTYSGWILKYESTKKRATMIVSLARHWRKLLGNYIPAELGKCVKQSPSLAQIYNLRLAFKHARTFNHMLATFVDIYDT